MKEQTLLQDIRNLEISIYTCSEDEFIKTNTELQRKKSELEDIYKYQAEGAFIRSRARYSIEGEKPSKLFCTLERHNAIQKYIPKLNVVRDGVDVSLTNQKDIEIEAHSFYKHLFDNKDEFLEDQTIEDFLGRDTANHCPKLSSSEKLSLEGKLTIEELTIYLKQSKNCVAPGSTVFSNEFYKFFCASHKFSGFWCRN